MTTEPTTCSRVYSHQYRGDVRRWYECARHAGHSGACYGSPQEPVVLWGERGPQTAQEYNGHHIHCACIECDPLYEMTREGD